MFHSFSPFCLQPLALVGVSGPPFAGLKGECLETPGGAKEI